MLMFRPLMRYADFTGRASKAEYWRFLGAQTVVYLICLGLAVLSLTKGGASGVLSALAWLSLLGLLVLALMVPNYAVLARRLHDIGRSAVWMLLLLPGVASQLSGFSALGNLILHATSGGSGLTQGVVEQSLVADAAGAGLLTLVAGACNMALLIMTVLPGQPGPNRFGPDPKDLTVPDTHALDEDRWDALIAEAKRGDPDVPYKPVFDFGPGPITPEPVRRQEPAPFPAQPQEQWSNPAWDPGVAPSRPFGRRVS